MAREVSGTLFALGSIASPGADGSDARGPRWDVRQAQLAGDQTGLLARARIWLDRGMEETRKKLRSFFPR
jgi:hypothetical protein